ncbi:DUF1206 domain-containing protein [Amycolatopsis sp. 195334CR]|uniref:DUF1206 domain-containing protein n=1 Tax=Amycolatopsis sp. 195334CR TaxID=2814588 RepID=UPI001A901F02|nr:DUF1206 domain-containing protein [Amycolatopsis sp. 195334CR]MBN6037629.1 DUF1206 domain-containing protein [Amycolatopsis sp. 195334CR]
MEKEAHEVARSAPFQLAARLGLVAYGVVHLLVAWLAVQVALGAGGKADKTGALQSISGGAWGSALLWLIAAGLAVTTLWQLFSAVTGSWRGGAERWLRAMNLGEAVLFGYLAYSAGKLAAGKPASSTDSAQLGLIGYLLSQSWGKPVVVALGVGIVVAAAFIARHGLTKRFSREHDLSKASRGVRTVVLRLGQVGYSALGTVYGVAGVLVVIAALRSRPEQATGLDVALKHLAGQPYGSILLVAIALGLAAFALFTLFDARYRRAT